MENQGLLEALLARARGQQPQAQPATPAFQGNPWDDPAAVMGQPAPVVRPPQMPQPPMPQPGPGAAVGATNPNGPLTPVDEALLKALQLQQRQQAIAQGTGNPTGM